MGVVFHFCQDERWVEEEAFDTVVTQRDDLRAKLAAADRPPGVPDAGWGYYIAQLTKAKKECSELHVRALKAEALLSQYQVQMLADELQVKEQLQDLISVMEQLKSTHARADRLEAALRGLLPAAEMHLEEYHIPENVAAVQAAREALGEKT